MSLKTIKRDEFVLIKLKALDSKGVSVVYANSDPKDEKTYSIESQHHAHEDLKVLLNRLKPIVAKIFHWNFGMKVLDEKLFGTTAQQSQFLTTFYNEMIDKITVTGIGISGMGDKQGVVITSVFDSLQGGVAVNSKAIKFNGTKYGFEEEVEELVEEIRKEVFLFVDQGKVEADDQLDLFPEDEDDDLEEEEGNGSPEQTEGTDLTEGDNPPDLEE